MIAVAASMPLNITRAVVICCPPEEQRERQKAEPDSDAARRSWQRKILVAKEVTENQRSGGDISKIADRIGQDLPLSLAQSYHRQIRRNAAETAHSARESPKIRPFVAD
jgi:hypothetical protein